MSALGAPDAAAYLAALERELEDLAPDERDDLLDEVEASLLEMDDDPVARLGSPAHFAAELRASAGLPPARAAVRPRRPLRERLAPALRIARDLAPIWWAARAYVLVLVLAAVFAAPVTKVGGIPRFGSAEAGAVILAAVLVGSIALGLAGRRRLLPARSLRITLDVALAGCAIFLALYEVDRRVLTGYSFSPDPVFEAPSGPAIDGTPINNLYVYDRNGKLLRDVRIYDSFARPLDVRPGDQDESRRVLTTRTGEPIFNSFPIRYYEPGTKRIRYPDAAPRNLKPPKLTR